MNKRFKHKNLLSACLCCVAICFVLSGCGQKEEGPYSGKAFSEIEEGYYIKSGNLFYPLIDEGKVSSNDMTQLNNEMKAQTVWLSENRDKIPVLNKDTELVVKQSAALPDVTIFQSMQDYGVTMGMTLSRINDPTVYGLVKEKKRALCSGSSADNVFMEMTENIQDIRITEIGGVRVNEDMLSDINTLKNLEENNVYTIAFYEGSNYREAKIAADTRVFVSNPDSRYVSSQYNYKKEGYVSLVLPENMGTGYYYLDDRGIFYYEKEPQVSEEIINENIRN